MNEPVNETRSTTTAQNASEMVLASAWQRLGNYLLDFLFMYCFAFIIGFAFALVGLADVIEKTNEYLLGIIILFVYYVSLETAFGRTLGKLVTGTQAVSENGNKLTFGQALARTLCRFIPFEPLSFLLGHGPIGWHDRIPKTRVITLRKGVAK